MEFVNFLSGCRFGGFGMCEVVGNVYIYIWMGIEHAAYYYAGVKFKTLSLNVYPFIPT